VLQTKFLWVFITVHSVRFDLNILQKEKPLTMRQHVLQSVLNPTSRSPSPEPLTHAKEQEALRSETIAAFHTAVDVNDDEDEEDLLVPREKTKDELEREEEEYREFLQREVGENLDELIRVEAEEDSGVVLKFKEDEAETNWKSKKKITSKTPKNKEEEDHQFLMKCIYLAFCNPYILSLCFPYSYILNRGWIDRTAKRLPTYNEITTSNKSKGPKRATADDDISADGHETSAGEDIEDDEDFEEVADLFETSYNFRFEEPYVLFFGTSS
jgi:protein KRI1